jgi:hypothetical protein
MSIQSLRRTGSCRFLIALLALGSWSGIAAAQDESAGTAPLNAHTKRYGHGWECDRGYRDLRRSCVAVEVPANEATGRPTRHARRSKCLPTPFSAPTEADGSAAEGTEGSTSPAWLFRYPRTPIWTLPEIAGTATEVSVGAATRAQPSRSLRKDTSGVQATIGNAIAVT